MSSVTALSNAPRWAAVSTVCLIDWTGLRSASTYVMLRTGLKENRRLLRDFLLLATLGTPSLGTPSDPFGVASGFAGFHEDCHPPLFCFA